MSLAPAGSVPMLTARLIDMSPLSPLGSVGACKTWNGLLTKKLSTDATARGSADPNAIAPPAAAPTTKRPSRRTSFDVTNVPAGSGSLFSSKATPNSGAVVPLVMVVVTRA